MICVILIDVNEGILFLIVVCIDVDICIFLFWCVIVMGFDRIDGLIYGFFYWLVGDEFILILCVLY